MENGQKYALITGGTQGIGYELSQLFANDRYNLILVARDQAALGKTTQELQEKHGVTVHAIAKDLMDSRAPFEVYEAVRAKGLQIEVLVNNAGQGVYGKFEENDVQRELDIINLNIKAYVVLTKMFLKEMVARNKGRILNVGSIAGEMPGPWQAVYHGTKAFVHSWTEAIRNEIKDTDVTVTLLVPGATDTDFFAKAGMERSKIYLEEKLSDPAKVAQDGYKALMKGEEKVVSGFMNKAMVAMGNLAPDSLAAEAMRKQQEPKKEGNPEKD